MMNYLSDTWCGLKWSGWVPLSNEHNELKKIPTIPGLYRIRPIGKDFLIYIGQTGRSLRGRMGELRAYTRSSTEMPYNDPHTAAPSLWAWRDAEGWEFECSVAPAEYEEVPKTDSRQMREGLECYLLWQYRLEKGESTYCNFGRFHHRYFKSSNRKSGRRGGRFPGGEINPSGGPSLPPLNLQGRPIGEDWMGLDWTFPVSLVKKSGNNYGNVPGLYKIILDNVVVYIGQSLSLKLQLSSHVNKQWGREPKISVCMTDEKIRDYQLHEWENDLIAGYFSEWQRPPRYQFKNHQ